MVEPPTGIGRQFEAERAVAGDDGRVVIGMDMGHALRGIILGLGEGGEGIFAEFDLPAGLLGQADIERRRRLRHQHQRARADSLRNERDRDRMIAARDGDDTALQFGFAQPHQLVVAAADLERAAELQALDLHPGLDAKPRGKPGTVIGRRAADLAGDARRRGLDVGE